MTMFINKFGTFQTSSNKKGSQPRQNTIHNESYVFWIYIQTWNNSKQIFTDIRGTADIDGMETCPSPSYKYQTSCCCGNGCCWDDCSWSPPPQNCTQRIPNSKWVYDIVDSRFKVMKLVFPWIVWPNSKWQIKNLSSKILVYFLARIIS